MNYEILENKTPQELMSLYSNLLSTLKKMKVIRTKNIVGDYAEWLVCEKLNLKQSSTGNKGYDAKDQHENKYQIKCRVEAGNEKKRKSGIIKCFDEKPFDFLIVVIFDGDYKVKRASKVPIEQLNPYLKINDTGRYTIDLSKSFWENKEFERIEDCLNS